MPEVANVVPTGWWCRRPVTPTTAYSGSSPLSGGRSSMMTRPRRHRVRVTGIWVRAGRAGGWHDAVMRCGRGWGEDMDPGVPAAVVAEFAGHRVAGLPFFAPETVTVDHGHRLQEPPFGGGAAGHRHQHPAIPCAAPDGQTRGGAHHRRNRAGVNPKGPPRAVRVCRSVGRRHGSAERGQLFQALPPTSRLDAVGFELVGEPASEAAEAVGDVEARVELLPQSHR
jgi:hypothetical protein